MKLLINIKNNNISMYIHIFHLLKFNYKIINYEFSIKTVNTLRNYPYIVCLYFAFILKPKIPKNLSYK